MARPADRVGIFGGTFDPPHAGHVSVARDVADALELDEVLWIPAGRSPFKPEEPLTPAPIRLRMVRAAVADDDRFRVSEIEIARGGLSYMVDTLRELREGELADAELYLILGADQYRDFESWRSPDEIRELATLVVMDRGDESVDRAEIADDEDAVHVPVRRVEISSTEIRSRVAHDDNVTGLVPPEVGRIIDAEGLYREGRE